MIVKQPKLGKLGFRSAVLWGQIIKSKIYKKAIKAYGFKRYSCFIVFGEDSIIN